MENVWKDRNEWLTAPAELREKLNNWVSASKSYYNVDEDSELSDVDFDKLTNELKLELVDYPHALRVIKGTITKIDTEESQVYVDENTEQISLDKIQYESLASVPKIHRWFNGALTDKECVVGPKLDGISIKVKMEHDYFHEISDIKQITTRGGQDVTEELRNHPDIVALLKYTQYQNIHGELVVPKKLFYEKWSTEILGDDNGYANPRNAVVGILKKEPNDLRFIACTDGTNPVDIGFEIWTKVEPNMDWLGFFEKYKRGDWFPFQIDGLVVGYKTDKRIVKDNYPMNMVSVKFPAPKAKTKVIGFEWSQKKSGNLTPMYLLEPVQLDGTICKRANAYNYDSVKKAHCGVGSEVIITKSNDIIPIIDKVLTRSNDIIMPSVEYTVVGKHAVAVDDTLSVEYRFVLGLKLLEIDGIGETIANQIGGVVDFDIIQLFNPRKKVDIRAIMGDGKTFEKFCSIYSIKNIPLDQLIEIMQFNRCGKVLSRKFAEIITGKKIDTKGIEKELLLHICKNEGFQQIKQAIGTLSSFGVKVIKPVEINADTITFEMTGSPQNGMTKKDFVDQFKVKYPNSTQTTLNKNTSYLFVDSMASNSSKMNKARRYNIPIYTYEQALNLDNLK